MKSGGRGRLSTLWAWLFLLFLILVAADLVRQIPMPALLAVMVMVSIGTFRWSSLRDLVVHPKSSSIVMLATVAVTVATHDLAQGVLAGVLLTGIFFARKVARLFAVSATLSADGTTRTDTVTGQIVFASAEAFDLREAVERVVIDASCAHVWDLTAVAGLDRVVLRLREQGRAVDILGMNEASAILVDRLGIQGRPAASRGTA